MKLNVVPILVLSLLSCNRHERYHEQHTIEGDSLKYSMMDNAILYDTSKTTNKSYFHSIRFMNGVNYSTYLNLSDSSVEVFNLDSKMGAKMFSLSKEQWHKDSLGEITGLYVHTLDSIFILQDYQLSLFFKGQRIKQYPLNTPTDSMCARILNDNPISYDATQHNIIIQHTCCWCTSDSFDFFMSAPIVYYNIDNYTYKVPKISYSAMYLDHYYGFKRNPSLSFNDSNTIICYPVDPNIYVVNNYTFQQTIYGGRSRFQQGKAKTVKDRENSEKKLIDVKHDFSYQQVYYDGYRNLYYRIFQPELPLKNKNNKYNTTYDRENILMVFNHRFELLNEIKLPNATFPTIYSNKEGIYILKYNKEKRWRGSRYYMIKFL